MLRTHVVGHFMQQPAIHLRQFPATVTFQIESIRRGGFRHILELYAGAITGHDLIHLYNMRGNMQDIYSFFTHFATFRTACSKLTAGV